MSFEKLCFLGHCIVRAHVLIPDLNILFFRYDCHQLKLANIMTEKYPQYNASVYMVGDTLLFFV